MLELKNVQNKKYVLGQFFTNIDICNAIVKNINFEDSIIIEPSFGSGNFLKALKSLPNKKIGIELDEEIYSEETKDDNTELYNMNFYDFNYKTNKKLIFIGNPPYRTPAYSLRTHKKKIAQITNKYNVLGIREEAVFFILQTIDIILENNIEGEIHYIIPVSIVKNNSKFFTRFKEFLKDTCYFMNVKSIQGTEFENVDQDLICLSLKVCNHNKQEKVMIDGQEQDLDKFLCLDDSSVISFHKIFKKTYLGSVPCESLLVSCPAETKEHFRDRLVKLIKDKELDKDKLYELLQYNNRFHLKVFDKDKESKEVQDKLDIILSYVHNIQNKDILEELENLNNYHIIKARSNNRYYFRSQKIKKNKNFVYEITPYDFHNNNIFYFTSNPSNSSTDYFGYSDCGDVLRNCSPGCLRFVPKEEDIFTDYIKEWWNSKEEFRDKNILELFDYIIKVSNSNWYKHRKKHNKRFYFSIPKDFVI